MTAPLTVGIAEITAEWIALRAMIAKRDGHALRAGPGNTIEVQSMTPPHAWHPLALSANLNAIAFKSTLDRDATLAGIIGAASSLNVSESLEQDPTPSAHAST